MPLPRWVYYFVPAFLTECALMAIWLAEPIFALNRLHATPLQLGLMGMGNGGGYALLAIMAGWLSDRTGRRGWMLLGTSSQIVIVLILPHCRQVWLFMLLATAHSTLLAFFWAPYMSMISETTPSRRLARALSLFNMSWCLGGIVGAAFCGQAYDRLGPGAPFTIGAALVGLSLLIQIIGRPGPLVPHEEHHAGNRPRIVRLMKQAWLVLVGNFFVVSLLMYLFPKLAQSPRFGLGATFITSLHGIRMGAMLATFALMGAATRWHFRQWPVHLCFALMLAMLVLTAGAPAAWLLLPAFTLFGVTTGIAYGLSAYYSMLAPAGKGAVVGTHEMFLSTGSTIGPIFGGVVIWATSRPEAPFWIGLFPLALLWLACAALGWGMPKRQPAPSSALIQQK